MTSQSFTTGRGTGRRQSHHPRVGTGTATPLPASSGPAAAAAAARFPVQSSRFTLPNYPFQPLPKPNGPSPYRYDLSQLLQPEDIQAIVAAGSMTMHTVGDTGDYRGRQQDFVSAMMTADAEALPDRGKPAFFYHLGDVIYFAGDIDKYGDNFYATYKNYPCFIVAIPGNHDCQPDDPQDGPVDPNKVPLDGWVQNFMSPDPSRLGSLKTGAGRTQLDLPNVYWTFTTPFATIIGLFSNVGETEGEFHQDQLDWLTSELSAADPALALVVAVHHPPFSGDTEHSGSSAVYTALYGCFAKAGRYPDLILSGHVHNYQRFTNTVQGPNGPQQITCIVAGAGGYTNLGTIQTIDGHYPAMPLQLGDDLRLEQYDQADFGFLRLEFSRGTISGSYIAAPYTTAATPTGRLIESFTIDLAAKTVATV
jgi:hypothetical protein